MATGISVTHRTARSQMVLIPVLSKPFPPASRSATDPCPGCHLLHPCKTVHLWVDDRGTALVSEGVLADLRAAGMPELQVTGSTKRPPALRLGSGVTREQIDHGNRRMRIWNTRKAG